MFHWKRFAQKPVNFRCFFTFNIHIFYCMCSQASLKLDGVCTELMFDFTDCVLYNPAPPPSAVSKYTSVTLPLKPVLCDKGCVLRWDWNAKFPWVTASPVRGALIRNPPLVICKSVVQGTLNRVTQGQTWPPEKHPSLAEPSVVKSSSLRAENKEKRVKFDLARSRLHSFQERGQWYLQSWLQA